MNCDLKSLTSDSFQSEMGDQIKPEHPFFNENAAETDMLEVVFTPDQEDHTEGEKDITKGEISATLSVTVDGRRYTIISRTHHN